jgi:catechol 2,3-dioxygenase-like lactoylglutathione lyase family enzyme
MALSLNHYSIRSFDLPACQHFYCDVLGLQVGPRPPFEFPGLWLYAGDLNNFANAVVHIIGFDRNDPDGLTRYLGKRDDAAAQGTGVVDHVAFFATGLAETLARLQTHKVACRERTVPVLNLYQVFVDDPNGVVVELNFPAAEKSAMVAATAATNNAA